MAGQNFQVVPKFIGNFIEIYFDIQGNGTVYKLATLEMPNDNQMVDNVDFAKQLCDLYKKRIRKSIR